MSRRVITPDVFADEWFGVLSDRQALLWIGLFGVAADDQGRLLDNPALVRSRLFPYRDVPLADVTEALEHFVISGRLRRYTAGGRRVLQIVTWWRHQRPQWAQPSKWPPPPHWQDRTRTRTNGKYVELGWDLLGGFTRTPHPNPSPDDVEPVDNSAEPFTRALQVNPSGEGAKKTRDLQEVLQVNPSGAAQVPEPVPEEEQDLELLSDSDESDARSSIACRDEIDEITTPGPQELEVDAPAAADDAGLEAAPADDDLFSRAARVVVAVGAASVPLLAIRCSVDVGAAEAVLSELEAAGIVGPPTGGGVREVLIDETELAGRSHEPLALEGCVVPAPDDRFEEFWGVYPRHEAKRRAKSAWSRLSGAKKDLAIGVATIMGELVAHGRQEKRFVPQAATFVNGERWEDWREGIPAGWQVEGDARAAAREASLQAAMARYRKEHPDEPG